MDGDSESLVARAVLEPDCLHAIALRLLASMATAATISFASTGTHFRQNRNSGIPCK
jgi:hypothetical protein